MLGSNSFSGASFVSHALNRGATVIGVSRSPEPVDALLPYKWVECRNFTFYQYDLNKHIDKIIGVVNEFQPDAVVNFAAQSMVAESWLNPEDWFQTNLMANLRLHESLRKCSFLKRYVHISTPEVYGSCSGRVTEDAPYNPTTPYAVSRAACDMSLMTYFKAYQFPVVFTRAANVYGPGQQLYRIIPRTILFIRLGRKLQLHGGGASVRSFIHIKDVAEGTWRAMAKGDSGDIFHFSTNVMISIRDLVAKICQKLDTRFEDAVEVAGERLGKDMAYILDSEKARKKLGWTDRIGLDEGIGETIEWASGHFESLVKHPVDYVHKK